MANTGGATRCCWLNLHACQGSNGGSHEKELARKPTQRRSRMRLLEFARQHLWLAGSQALRLSSKRIAIYPGVGCMGIDRLLNFVAGGVRRGCLCGFYPVSIAGATCFIVAGECGCKPLPCVRVSAPHLVWLGIAGPLVRWLPSGNLIDGQPVQRAGGRLQVRPSDVQVDHRGRKARMPQQATDRQ